jgi:hypothetical protein
VTRRVPPHYIRENKAARVPHRLVIIDSEAISDRRVSDEVQQWRCGAAMFVHWTNRGYRHEEIREYWRPQDLWADVAEFTKKRERTVLYAHNLPYDMRITNALTWLPRCGFTLTTIRIASQGAWSKWSRSEASLTLCDSASLFPVTVHTLGRFLGKPKLGVADDSDDAAWMARCVRDVEILGETLIQYFEWLRTGVAGNWQVTGAGQSWAHWRHNHYDTQVLIHADDEATAAERRAMWAGRAENWQWGKDLTAPVYEWDWQNAYPRLTKDHDVPVKLTGTTRSASAKDLVAMMKRWIVLADVEVETDHPIVPARHDKRILWPVGKFETTLWSPELQLLIETGARIKVRRMWLYKPAPALKSWAEWILRELNERSEGRARWQSVLLKHWSRALIGRFATQYQDWELLGYDPVEKVTTGRLYDVATGESGQFMQIGHEIHLMTGVTESDDACPQITSYIMSLGRAQLWRAIQEAGEENTLYMDTDSVVVNAKGHARIQAATRNGMFPGLRLKGKHSGYEIYGPRAAVIGGETKLSGIPRQAARTDETVWVGEVWTQFERAIATGEYDRVVIAKRRYTIRWNEFRRGRVAGGRTQPYELPGYVTREPAGELEPVTDAEHAEWAAKQFTGQGEGGNGRALGIGAPNLPGVVRTG